MTVQLLSFPMQLTPQGFFATGDDTSAAYCAERLSVILGTQPGERRMAPGFGINDPAFDSFTEQALRVQVEKYGLPVEIGAIQRVFISDAQENISISFDMSNRGRS